MTRGMAVVELVATLACFYPPVTAADAWRLPVGPWPAAREQWQRAGEYLTWCDRTGVGECELRLAAWSRRWWDLADNATNPSWDPADRVNQLRRLRELAPRSYPDRYPDGLLVFP